VKTTLSTGKRLADDEAARLLDAANGVPAVGNEPLREQIAEFAKAVTDGMGSMAKVTEFVEAMQSRGGGDVSEELIMGNAVPATGEIRTTEGKDWYSEAAKWLKSQWDESGATVQSLEEIRGTDDVSKAVFRLRQSVVAFHERYGTASKPNAVQNQAKAAAQEMGEYVWSVAAGDLEGAAKEAADVLYTVFGVAMLAGITREQLADAMYAIAASNDDKTPANGWDWNARGTKVEKLK